MTLSDEEWARVREMLEAPTPKTGQRPVDARRVLEAILWIVENNEKWRYLPSNFPPQQTCYNKWLSWKKTGKLDEALRLLGRSSE